jgi:hypothetical protein
MVSTEILQNQLSDESEITDFRSELDQTDSEGDM